MKMMLWRDDVHLAHVVQSSQQRHDVRIRLYLRMEHNGVEGWGEIDPQPFALNGDPSVDEIVYELDKVLVTQVAGAFEREATAPSWTRIARFAGPRAASAWAVALVEMALLDRELREGETDLVSLWPKNFDTPRQVGVSLIDDAPIDAREPGAVRVRAKIAPGILDAQRIEQLAGLDRPVLLDYNCSAISELEVLEQLGQLRDGSSSVVVSVIEQPFAPGNLVDHARLAQECDVAISLDEGVRTLRDIEQVVRYDAAHVVCVKPARTGGYANARTMIERAKQLGLRPYLGGFFESPLARHVNRTLAQHCVSEPSDIGDVSTVGRSIDSEFEVLAHGFGLAPSAQLLAKATLLAT